MNSNDKQEMIIVILYILIGLFTTQYYVVIANPPLPSEHPEHMEESNRHIGSVFAGFLWPLYWPSKAFQWGLETARDTKVEVEW